MTQKSEVVELIKKFFPHSYPYIGGDFLAGIESDEAKLLSSKCCAKIAVNEILILAGKMPNNIGLHYKKYWEESLKMIDEIKIEDL